MFHLFNSNMKFIEKILSVPKSLYVSIKLCGLKNGIRLPIFVRYNTVLRDISGHVITPAAGGIFCVGFGSGEGTADVKYVRSVLEVSGTIIVEDYLRLGAGTRLCVSGTLHVNSMTNTSRLHLVCMDKITIGKNVLIGWDTCIMDSDMHTILNLETKEILPKTSQVTIGDNVLIGTRCLILKGSNIPNGCIVGARSVVTKPFSISNSILAGNPARVVKTGYTRLKKIPNYETKI